MTSHAGYFILLNLAIGGAFPECPRRLRHARALRPYRAAR